MIATLTFIGFVVAVLLGALLMVGLALLFVNSLEHLSRRALILSANIDVVRQQYGKSSNALHWFRRYRARPAERILCEVGKLMGDAIESHWAERELDIDEHNQALVCVLAQAASRIENRHDDSQ